MTYNTIARTPIPSAIAPNPHRAMRAINCDKRPPMAFDGRRIRANDAPVATPRRAMFATAKTTSFATGVAVRATRSTQTRRVRCVTRRRDRPRDARRESRSRANDARRARGEGRSYLERRGTTTRRATTRDADVRGACEGRETRARTRASDAIGTRNERRRGFGEGWRRARGARSGRIGRGARGRDGGTRD